MPRSLYILLVLSLALFKRRIKNDRANRAVNLALVLPLDLLRHYAVIDDLCARVCKAHFIDGVAAVID